MIRRINEREKERKKICSQEAKWKCFHVKIDEIFVARLLPSSKLIKILDNTRHEYLRDK